LRAEKPLTVVRDIWVLSNNPRSGSETWAMLVVFTPVNAKAQTNTAEHEEAQRSLPTTVSREVTDWG